MTETTKIEDAIYFLHPEGGSWIAARFRSGHLISQTQECNAATHAAANDFWADVVPSGDDAEIGGAVAEAIVREVMGDEVDPALVVVTIGG